MTVPMMKEMLEAGMSIGSHTLTHPRLARIDPEQMRAEVEISKRNIEDALGEAVTSFCYPYGNFNAATITAVREAGYLLATSTIRGNTNSEADRFTLKRAMVTPGRSGLRFRYMFSPLYRMLHDFKNRDRWKPREGGGE
jgi:peptidoglycan/xylan/chitin deacetylase (PgdA/CDA1 family)